MVVGVAWTCHLIAILSLPSVPPEDWVQSHPFPRGNKHSGRVPLAPTVLDTATVSFTSAANCRHDTQDTDLCQLTGSRSFLGFGLDVVERTGVGLRHPKTKFSTQRRFVYPRGTKGRDYETKTGQCVVAHTFNPRTLEAETDASLTLRPAWSTK